MTLAEDLAIYAKMISDDIEHGASHVLKIASGSLDTALKKNSSATSMEIRGACREYALRIMGVHRRLAPILNFCNHLLLEIETSKDDPELGKKLSDFAITVSEQSSEALEKVAAHANGVISGNHFMTHSRSSTLFHFLNHIRDRDDLQVYITQSRPGGEGRLLAGELAVAGIRTVLIEDAEVMRYLDRVSAVLVGTDAIIPGGVVNKVGTHMVSLAARELGLPIYCLTESIKIWPFDEPILTGLSKGFPSPLGSFEFFELIPGSAFSQFILNSGPTTFDEIVLKMESFHLAQEMQRLAGL